MPMIEIVLLLMFYFSYPHVVLCRALASGEFSLPKSEDVPPLLTVSLLVVTMILWPLVMILQIDEDRHHRRMQHMRRA